MNRLFVFLIAIGLHIGITYNAGSHVGVTSQCINEQCFVSASTSIISIIFGIGLIIYAIKFPRAETTVTETNAGFWRRFSAFLIDFIALLTALASVVALPTIFAEYLHTNTFSWSFQRDYSRRSDLLLIIPSVLIMMTGLIYYFYKFTLSSKQTLGQYILGYRVITTDGNMNKQIARKRVTLSIIGLALWPIAVIHGLIKKKRFWWDSGSHSQAVRIVRADTVDKPEENISA